MLDGGPEKYQRHVASVVARWLKEDSTDDDVIWLDWLLRNQLLSNSKDAAPELASLIEEYRRLEMQVAPPRVIDGMADGGPGHDTPVFLSGDPKAFEQFLAANRFSIAHDLDGDPVFMAQSAFSLNYTLERVPDIRAVEIKEMHKAA